MNILPQVQHLLPISLSLGQIAGKLTVALVCGLLIAQFYTWVVRRPGSGRSFVSALILLTMITALVIMVIGNNLARAFGLVGAMSIVRFRTAVKDVRDIVFIFFSLAVGLAAGVGLTAIALMGALFVGLVALITARLQTHVQKRRDYLLQFSYTPSGHGEPPYLPIFSQYCRRHHLLNSRLEDNADQLELSFHVRLKNQEQSADFLRSLGRQLGVQRVNLFFDEEYE